jgi:hypothetical protein
MVAHVETLTHELSEMLETWQERIDHLQKMMAGIGVAARSCNADTIQRLHAMAEDARDLLSQSRSMTPEQWIDARTAILTTLQTLQHEYNAIIADWPQE